MCRGARHSLCRLLLWATRSGKQCTDCTISLLQNQPQLKALCEGRTRLAALLPALAQGLHQQQVELAGARELGRAAKAAVPGVVAAGQRGRAGVDRGRRGPRAQLRALACLCSRAPGTLTWLYSLLWFQGCQCAACVNSAGSCISSGLMLSALAQQKLVEWAPHACGEVAPPPAALGWHLAH